jgi:hypothetical protein
MLSSAAKASSSGRRGKEHGGARLYEVEEIEGVHLELTDKCNAACPQVLHL